MRVGTEVLRDIDRHVERCAFPVGNIVLHDGTAEAIKAAQEIRSSDGASFPNGANHVVFLPETGKEQ